MNIEKLKEEKEAWFESWFDTPYYHQLYKDRDDKEARLFIRNIIDKLQPDHKAHFLDLACGRGRHAKFLSELDYDVTGLDLSESNIDFAQRFANSRLHFEVGDMRESFGENRFDYIFNMFTSFGYFDFHGDNLRALKMMRKALKPSGTLVLDFMNVNKVRLGLVTEEVRQVENIEFHIERFIRDERVIKKITFEDNGKKYQYEEKVQLLDKADFEELFEDAGFTIQSIYGDFDLSDYDADNGERLILVAK